MMAVFSFRQGSVAAFSIAAISTKASRTSAMKRPVFTRRVPTLHRHASTASTISTPTTTTTTDALEKTLEVTHPSFEVIQRDVVTEYGAYCSLYRHIKSGAELLSVSTDDDNKVFGITFRTPPDDSTGVPHILEHSVLCGSRKYTTKDPFVHLLKGSLQTFLNAFTYPDRTCYVVASQNVKDFYNLANVYADAVFHPRAVSDPMVHAQEGWHLEMEEKSQPLTYKGVVYNEMKGVYSSPDSLLNRASQRSIFPDNTYSVDSGGDPRVIPDLSFEQFADFHAKFYHPSNARIYFSGDDDVLKRLELMDGYLNDFDASPEYAEKSKIEWQKKIFTEPKREEHFYPAGADQPETHMLTVNWLLNDKAMSAEEELTLGVLDHLLMGTTSAVLRKTLMESGLGDAITGGGLSDELLQATYSVGLKGIAPEKVGEVEALILDTLKKVAEEGFEDDDIASSLNTIEFDMREFNTGSFPKGLSFMLGSMSKWLYGDSPTDALKFEAPLAALKEKIAESGSEVFKDMLHELIISNLHRTTVELKPSKTLEDELVEDEEKRLALIKSKLSDDELESIIQKTVELKALQGAEDSAEARATIPSLKLSDLKRETTEYPIDITENEKNSGITVVRHEVGSTSGIAYVNFAVDISKLSIDEVSLLPIFRRALTETGAGDLDSVALSRKIGTHTGGVSTTVMTTAAHTRSVDESLASTGENMQTKLLLRGKATSEKIGELFDIFKLILTDAKLDSKPKIIEMLRESRSRLESSIQGSGHSMVSSRMSARHRVTAFVDEMTGGITYLDTVKRLLKEAEEDWPSLLTKLENIRSTILDQTSCRAGMILDITGDKQVLESIQPSVEKFLTSLPGNSKSTPLPDFYEVNHPWVAQARPKMAELTPMVDEGFVVPTQVSYVGKSGFLYEPGEKIPGSAAVVARFLRTGYLWDHVRVMGGAYGGFCQFSSFSGFFAFLSYRDPNLHKTIDVYDQAADALEQHADALEKDPEMLETAIIGTIGDMDGSMSPDQKGFAAFQRWLINEGPEYRQKYRDEVLDTKVEDFREFARRLRNMKNTSSAVVSSKAKFEEAAAAGKTFVLKEVMKNEV
jgi:Zn-dependent M16 (insulinase) family peptidase